MRAPVRGAQRGTQRLERDDVRGCATRTAGIEHEAADALLRVERRQAIQSNRDLFAFRLAVVERNRQCRALQTRRELRRIDHRRGRRCEWSSTWTPDDSHQGVRAPAGGKLAIIGMSAQATISTRARRGIKSLPNRESRADPELGPDARQRSCRSSFHSSLRSSVRNSGWGLVMLEDSGNQHGTADRQDHQRENEYDSPRLHRQAVPYEESGRPNTGQERNAEEQE